ncbi:MAG: hypothetical protein K8I00_00875, partial [Candidatus Omnitrophica bacterium]|nr:hypothetical protein [Candidatus Omnitrophota bacterium]
MNISSEHLVLDQDASLSRLATIKTIRHLEARYKKSLSDYPESFRSALKLYRRLNGTYLKLSRYLESQQRHNKSHPSGYPAVLKDYHSELAKTHKTVERCLLLYLGAWLDHDSTLEFRREIRRKWYLKKIQQRADRACEEAQSIAHETQWRDVLKLRAKYQQDKISPKQRLDYLELYRKRVSGLMQRVFRMEHYRLRELFNSILYAHSSLKDIETHERDAFNGDQRRHLLGRLREFIRDVLHGYTPRTVAPSSRPTSPKSPRMFQDVRTFEKGQQRRRLLSAVGVAILLTVGVNTLYRTGGDKVLARHLKWAWHDIVTVIALIPHATDKMHYFENEIIQYNMDVSREDLQDNLRKFLAEKFYQRRNKHEIYAEFILKDYLVLLAKGEVDPQMERDMYRAGFLVEPELLNILEPLNALYRRKVILESDLRAQMLALRRVLVNGGVYPHMFLVIREATPHVFMYPDKIEKSMPLLKEDLQKLGMDAFWYEDINNERLQAYFISGENYPFKGKAGFFEGEFAVVLTSLSSRPYWTAWHELGHIVDYMQYTFAGQPVPPNVEVNGVIFPLIFSDDPKTYLQQHVFKLIRFGDRRDSYVQSAKGILNGATLYLNELKGFNRPLITNRFEKDRVDWIWGQLDRLNNEQLRQLGMLMYRNQPKYLITAEAASYRTVFTNTEEIVYGVHGSPQKEVIDVTSGLAGLFSSSERPRFIRDGEGPGDDSAALRRAALIRAIIVFFLFELAAVLLHFLASPYRHFKARGRQPLKIIDRMFQTLEGAKNPKKNQTHLHT